MQEILLFLAALGCVPTSNIVVDANYQYLGKYTEGRVTVRSLDNVPVLVHELYHSCQKPAANGTEAWYWNELAARRVEKMWVER